MASRPLPSLASRRTRQWRHEIPATDISADLPHAVAASPGAGADGFITEGLADAPDHPMTLEFPEGESLKGPVAPGKP